MTVRDESETDLFNSKSCWLRHDAVKAVAFCHLVVVRPRNFPDFTTNVAMGWLECFIEEGEDIHPVRLGHGTVPDLFSRQISEI